MLRYIFGRLLALIPVILGVILVTMLIMDLIPGDPVELMLGANARPEEAAALRAYLGLDQPLPVRYVRYVTNLLRGDMGRSILTSRPVTQELMDVWPHTLMLALAAMALAVLVGITVGVLSAMQPGGLMDSLIRVFAMLGLSMPIFWIGLVLIYLFAYYLRLLPVGGADSWRSLILPAVTLALPSIAIIARMTRSSMLEMMRKDFVRTARAKGVATPQVLTRHVLRNTLIPVVTVIALQFGQLMGGAVLTETVFAWPGVGRLTVQAIFARDYILLQGAILLFALSFVIINLLVDISYVYIDPRLRA